MEHPFRPSDLTTSAASAPMAAQEAFLDFLDGLDSNDDDALDQLESEVETLVSEVEAYAYDREAALDAWENGNSQLEDLNETAQTALGEVSDLSVDNRPPSDFDTLDEYQEHVEEQVDEVRGIVDGLEF